MATLDINLDCKLTVKEGATVREDPVLSIVHDGNEYAKGNLELDMADGSMNLLVTPFQTNCGMFIILADNDVKLKINATTQISGCRSIMMRCPDGITKLGVEAENNDTRVRWWLFE